MVMHVLAGRIVYLSCDVGEHLTGQYNERACQAPVGRLSVQGVLVLNARYDVSGVDWDKTCVHVNAGAGSKTSIITYKRSRSLETGETW